ncbi:MAG TPA: AMP-binding protein [Acidimicrobiales bacterium]|nr:AMP-binding protein [Acidimicrobiales bacterium]
MTTMLGPLRRAVQTAADRPGVACGTEILTYAEVWDRCRRLVGGLRALEVGDGDRVAVVGPNCHRYLELYQAVPGAGMVLVPLNQRHTDAELRYALADSGTKVLFASRPVEGIDELVEHVLDLGEGYEMLLATADPADIADDLPDGTLAGLFYTGGTTGAAKGVMLTHRNLVANALHFQVFWPFRPETCWLIAAPLFHAAGSVAVLATVWNGGRQVVLPMFDAAAGLDLIERHGVTATLVVPTMLAAFTDEQVARPRDVSTLRAICHGGSPVATETVRRAHDAFPDAELLHLYGATETAPIATTLRGEELLLDSPRVRSCGQATVGVEVAVVGSDGQPVRTGEVGEVVVRGDNVMVGYWNKPEQTAEALVDGWYHTGDLGYMDEEAFVYLVDRAKDMIVTGGENVYSTEVEDALYRHPAVLEAAVFAIPDPHWGEAVHAVVVPRADVTAEELLAHCRGLIAGYKVPKAIEFRTEPLPKSGAGKVLKRELREPYWAGLEARVAGT